MISADGYTFPLLFQFPGAFVIFIAGYNAVFDAGRQKYVHFFPGSFSPVIPHGLEPFVIAHNNRDSGKTAANQFSQSGNNIKIQGILAGLAEFAYFEGAAGGCDLVQNSPLCLLSGFTVKENDMVIGI